MQLSGYVLRTAQYYGKRRAVLLDTRRHLNRLMLEPSEVKHDPEQEDCYCVLSSQDPRTQHVRSILKAEPGAHLRAGVLDAGR